MRWDVWTRLRKMKNENVTELMFCEECHKFLDTWPRKDTFLIWDVRTGKTTHIYFHSLECYEAYRDNPKHSAEICKWY